MVTAVPRLVFAGAPEFAVPSLQALLDAGYPLAAVYTQPDRPAGRGRRVRFGPVKTHALAANLPIHQPATLREPAIQAELTALAPDLLVVAAYGLILPPAVLAIPRLGCVNVHASLLPRWRGAAPIQRALLAGDVETGVCIMRMEAGLDTGPVYHRLAIPIAPDETGGSLHDRLSTLGARALIEALPGILDGTSRPEPQDDSHAIYAHKLDKAEAAIDWGEPAAAIERRVRAFDPWPVASTRLDGEVLRIWSARATAGDAAGASPGEVLATTRAGIEVATGCGRLRITRLQPPGKRTMDAQDFLNARRLDGARFD
jgi:methionyl-tRNA formyltransferase